MERIPEKTVLKCLFYITLRFINTQHNCYRRDKFQLIILNLGKYYTKLTPKIQGVPLATEPDISLIILPLMRILQRLQTHTTDTFLFISHTPNVLLFKFRCNIFICVRIIKEMPGSVASGTYCINTQLPKRTAYVIIFEGNEESS